MAAVNTPTTLNGLYKRVYGKLVNAVPETEWFLSNIKWDQGNKVGDSFHQVVVLTNENGFTYGGSGGTAFTLNAAVAMGTAPASVTPFEYVMRSQISYGAASRAASAGPRAFAKAMTLLIKNAMESVTRRLEISCIYGTSAKGIGRVDATDTTSVSGTTFTLNFDEDQWAPGIWFGSEGAILEVYDEGDALETNGGSGDLTVTTVNYSTRKVLVTGASALVTQVLAKNASEYLTVFFKGAHDNDMTGIDKIFQNTTGTIHNISASTYGMWAGNLFDVGSAQLTHSHIMGFAAQLQGRGLNEDLIVMVNPLTWADLHQEQASARVYDESYNKSSADQGFQAIRYYCPSGWIRIVANPVVKAGDAFMFPKSVLRRIGSEDREWKIPGAESEPFHPIADAAGAEMRIYSDQTVFCDLPSRCAKVEGIVNTFGTTG